MLYFKVLNILFDLGNVPKHKSGQQSERLNEQVCLGFHYLSCHTGFNGQCNYVDILLNVWNLFIISFLLQH